MTTYPKARSLREELPGPPIRRVALLTISESVLDMWVRGSGNPLAFIERVATSIPKDAKLIHLAVDQASRSIFLFYEHESFQEVKDGERIPSLSLTMRSIAYEVTP